jgi:hypothetical protein
MREDIQTGLRTNEFDIVIGMLILLCPSITSCTLGLDVIVSNPMLTLIFHDYTLPRELKRCTLRLQRLKSITLGTNLDHCSCEWVGRCSPHLQDVVLDLSSYLTLLYLPDLKEAEIRLPLLEKWKRRNEFVWPAGYPPYSALQVLRLPDTSLPPKILHNILETTPCITRLDYEFKQWSLDKLQAQDLSSALACVKNTLKHFKFRYNPF